MMIAVGRITRPHGLHGTLRVTPLTDILGRFRSLRQVVVERPDGSLISLAVEGVKESPGAVFLKFQGIDSPEQAGEFRDSFILIRREDVPPLPEDTYYVFELIGYEVQTEEGQTVGTLSDVLRLPANDAYVVRHPRGEVLIPAIRDFVRIDTRQKKIFVRGVDELLE